MSAPRVRTVRHSATGAALVELAITLPVTMAILLGTIDFGRVFYTSMELTSAARAGAQLGASSIGASHDIDAMEAAAIASVNIGGVEASASHICECATDDGLTFSSTSPSTNNCTAPVATSCPTAGTHRVMTVSVTTSTTFTMTARFPGLRPSLPISRTATMRVTE